MTDSARLNPVKTVARASLEQLIAPELGPGRACLLVIRGRCVGQIVEIKSAPVVVGRSPDVELLIDDSAVSRRHAQVEHESDGFVLKDLDSTNGVFVNGVRVKRCTLKNGDRIQVGGTAILKFCFQDEVEADFQKTLYDSATRDSLTGLYNRRFFLETLETDFSYAFKNDTLLSLLLLDLDHFKAVNDSHGHLTGDAVIRQTGLLVQRSLRTEDVPARYGGEEFAVLLRYTDGPRAFIVAERIRQAVEAHRFEHEGHEVRISVSIGIATLEARSYPSATAFIEGADEFLYKAKDGGRNRTVDIDLAGSHGRLTAETVNMQATNLLAPAADSGPGVKREPGLGRRKTRILRGPHRRRKP